MATGPLSKPKLPGIAGIETYGGHAFHTSRWDYAYTGGDTTGGLTNLADKRVGIIDTGATAVQCIPHLGEWANQLYVFQRTPSSIDVGRNRPTDPAWAASLSPGWQQQRIENFGIIARRASWTPTPTTMWFALWSRGAHHWIPGNAEDIDVSRHVSIVNEDRVGLEDRTRRLQSGAHYGQDPPSRLVARRVERRARSGLVARRVARAQHVQPPPSGPDRWCRRAGLHHLVRGDDAFASR